MKQKAPLQAKRAKFSAIREDSRRQLFQKASKRALFSTQPLLRNTSSCSHQALRAQNSSKRHSTLWTTRQWNLFQKTLQRKSRKRIMLAQELSKMPWSRSTCNHRMIWRHWPLGCLKCKSSSASSSLRTKTCSIPSKLKLSRTPSLQCSSSAWTVKFKRRNGVFVSTRDASRPSALHLWGKKLLLQTSISGRTRSQFSTTIMKTHRLTANQRRASGTKLSQTRRAERSLLWDSERRRLCAVQRSTIQSVKTTKFLAEASISLCRPIKSQSMTMATCHLRRASLLTTGATPQSRISESGKVVFKIARFKKSTRIGRPHRTRTAIRCNRSTLSMKMSENN